MQSAFQVEYALPMQRDHLAFTLSMQRCAACKIQSGHQGAPNWPTRSGEETSFNFYWPSNQLLLTNFFDLNTSFMRNFENEWEKMENGNSYENSSLYVVAGQPPNRNPLQRCQVHFKCQLKLGRTLSEV